jgi:hypothetical protein
MEQQWVWWAGWKATVDDDGRYDIDSQPTREAVIASALRETLPGDQFYVIEAVMAPWDEDEHDEVQPFAATRNLELMTNGQPS